MSNDYLNPFGASNISSSTSTSSVGSVSVADNSNASIMANNSSSTMNYALSPSDLNEDDIELIKKELERKIQEQKEDLENAKSTRGWLTSAANSIAGWFGGGDKKAQNNISNYEALLKGLDSDISNINEVYKTIMGSDLDSASLQSLKGSEALANSIDSETQNAIVAELENQLAVLEGNFETAQNSNGWISVTWNAFKNWTGIGASSNKASAEINDLKEQIEKLKNGEADLATTFKNITGTDLNYDNLNSLLSGEKGTGLDSVSSAGQKVNAYSEGQKMCTDVVGDIASGILAVGAIALAPFTGGASIALAAGVGAVAKIAIKASDCIGNEKTYGLKDLGYDLVTGSINGAMAPISNGLGGAAGTGVAKMFGLKAAESVAKEGLEQAVKVAGKEVLEEVVEETGEAILKTVTKEALEEGAEALAKEGVEQAGKGILSKILAKQGTEYILEEGVEATAKTTIGKIASYATDMAVDGALSGATDGFARAAAEGRWEDIPQEMLTGGLGGLIASPIIGGGFRVAGKAGSTVINKINNKITIGSLLPDGTMTKFSQGEMGDCALLSMLDGFLGNSKTSKQIQNAITTSSDGGYNVKIGSQTVKIAREELTDEMLSDTTGIRVFELAYQKAGGSLDGEFAENVAKTFGLNPVHITSDGITDEVLETISKDSDNLVLSLGARVDADGTITPDGEFQHYFSIKNVDPETRTLTLVDTYDTSKTFEMSFDDVKTQGISIDGGSVKKTDLPNVERSADEVGFKGKDTQAAEIANNSNLTRKLTDLELETLLSDGKVYSEDEIQRYIEIIDTKGSYWEKVSVKDAKLFIDNGFDDEHIARFNKIKDRSSWYEHRSSEDIILEIKYQDMGLSESDISIMRHHGYTEEQAKKYMELKSGEDLYFDEITTIIDRNFNDEQIQRYLALKSKSDLGSRHIAYCVKEGYSDTEFEIYVRLGENYEAENYIKQLRQGYLSRELSTDEAISLKGNISIHEAQKFIDLKDNSSLSRNLTDTEAIFAIKESYTPDTIQKMIDLIDNPAYNDCLTLEDVKYIIDNELSDNGLENYIKTKNFLNAISITTQERRGWYLCNVQKDMGEWLQCFGVKTGDIKQDALNFVSKLKPEVIQYLTTFGDNNNYLARLLTKSDVFSDVDFDAITKNADFLNYLSEVSAGGKNLLSQVKNVAFLRNKDFDTEGMARLIKAFENVRIAQPETNKYNFSMLGNMAEGHNSITDILNNSSINLIKTAEFLEAMANIKITKVNGAQWSFADILKENWLYNSIFDKNIDYDKVIQLCECISRSDMYSKLSENDMSQITWLINNVSKNKYTNAQEYFDAYVYFEKLSTSDGNKMLTGRNGRMEQAEILAYMLNIDPSSVEASNIEMLTNLVQDGVVGKHVLEYLPSGGKLSSSIVDDIDKLYEAYTLGIKPIDMFVPTFKNVNEAVLGGNDSILFKGTYLDIKTGDVFQVEGEDFIRIKISNTESMQLNISKETYFKLFPPIERYATTQNNIGNCWEINGINSLLCESDTRISVLKLFHQDGNDIVIKFPNGQYEEIRFKNGKLPANANEQYYSQGALGIQMLEYADGKEMQGEWINRAYKKIHEMIANEADDNTRQSFEKGLVEFTEFIESHDGNVVISLKNGVHWEEYNGKYDSIMSNNRHGGRSNELYARLGYSEAQYLDFYNSSGWQKAQELLKDSKSFDNYILGWASDGKGIEEAVNTELGIVSNHAYRIKPATIAFDGTIETFKLINPWGIVETELTYEQVLKYGAALYIAKK